MTVQETIQQQRIDDLRPVARQFLGVDIWETKYDDDTQVQLFRAALETAYNTGGAAMEEVPA